MIPFNKSHIGKNEILNIQEVLKKGHTSGNGYYTKKCQSFFEQNYGIKKALLTTSCTDALEMCAILLNIKEGDEVIMPSYTFVSTANAFVLRGAKIIFVDSRGDNPNIDESKIESLITKKTKAIVVVHYAGIACEMDIIMQIAKKHQLFVIEDAAQAIDSYYKGKPLGSIGHLATFSFHETKNIQCGEGGLLAINDEQFIHRAEIIWEKGTNRSAFFRGEVDKYGWVDIGSSFLPSELVAAFLWGQLVSLDEIQKKRKIIWNIYYKELVQINVKQQFMLPVIPKTATNNGHLFYLVCKNNYERTCLINYLKENGIKSVFHYQCLHKSEFYINNSIESIKFQNSEIFTDRLLRLPLFYALSSNNQLSIINKIKRFYEK